MFTILLFLVRYVSWQHMLCLHLSFRYNLDPFNQNSDADIWNALDKCHVKPMVSASSRIMWWMFLFVSNVDSLIMYQNFAWSTFVSISLLFDCESKHICSFKIHSNIQLCLIVSFPPFISDINFSRAAWCSSVRWGFQLQCWRETVDVHGQGLAQEL